ncbi:MAG: alpha-N-acetylglucosaminidase C-terminal domain-containing protein [Acidobacteriaceae bacterium]
MIQALNLGDTTAFMLQSDLFLGMVLDQDRLLATQQEFLLGKWIAEARTWGITADDKDQMERNARTLLTLWGPKAAAASLHDYANREWSGLLSSFYHARWKLWINLQEKLLRGDSATPIDWYTWEDAWTRERGPFPEAPVGDPIAEARRIGEKYAALLRRSVESERS